MNNFPKFSGKFLCFCGKMSSYAPHNRTFMAKYKYNQTRNTLITTKEYLASMYSVNEKTISRWIMEYEDTENVQVNLFNFDSVLKLVFWIEDNKIN